MRAAVAFLLNFHVALYFATGHPAYQNPNPLLSRRLGQFAFDANSIHRSRRDGVAPITTVIDVDADCMLVTSDEGHYYYKSADNSEQVCGIYMIAKPDEVIEVIFSYLDVPCEGGGLVSWVDGWELNGQFFPSPRDHTIQSEDDRFNEFCGNERMKRLFVSSQNAALVQYRVPARRKGFSVIIRHLKNPRPCNILVSDTEGTYTLRNHKRALNCSLTAIFPATIRVLKMDVGVLGVTSHNEDETSDTGIVTKCELRHLREYVEIGGSKGLDNVNMERVQDICGKESIPAPRSNSILCDVSTVRLVSTGRFDNSVTVSLNSFDLEDEPTLTCME